MPGASSEAGAAAVPVMLSRASTYDEGAEFAVCELNVKITGRSLAAIDAALPVLT